MAVGDVVADVDSVTAGAPVDFQPAAGTEYVITAFSTNSANATLELYNGAVNSQLIKNVASPNGNTANLKIFINNTVYIRRVSSTGTVKAGYTGIQIK